MSSRVKIEATQRVTSRLGALFVHRCIRTIGAKFDGNARLGLSLLAVAQATRHGAVPPNEERAVPVRAISASLGIPNETMRRQLNALIRAGYCEMRKTGGIAIVASDTAHAAVAELRGEIGLRYKLLIEELQSVNVVVPCPRGETAKATCQNPQVAFSIIASNLLLRLLEVYSPVFHYDLTTLAVWVALLWENIGEVFSDTKVAQCHAALSTPMPGALRKPATALAASLSVGLPFETTRRHLAQLVNDGLCARVQYNGLLVDDSIVQSKPIADLGAVSALRVHQSLAEVERSEIEIGDLIFAAPTDRADESRHGHWTIGVEQ